MLGGELKKRRERMGLTQVELAARLNVHRVTLARWEGRHTESVPRGDVLRVMLQHLDDELVYAHER